MKLKWQNVSQRDSLRLLLKIESRLLEDWLWGKRPPPCWCTTISALENKKEGRKEGWNERTNERTKWMNERTTGTPAQRTPPAVKRVNCHLCRVVQPTITIYFTLVRPFTLKKVRRSNHASWTVSHYPCLSYSNVFFRKGKAIYTQFLNLTNSNIFIHPQSRWLSS